MELIIVHHPILIILKIIYLILGEGDTFDFNGNFGAPEKKLILILVKHAQNFASVYIIMLIIVVSSLMEKKSLTLKSTIKMLTFQHDFFSDVFLMDLVLESLENLNV